MIPVAQFGYSASLLVVSFADASSNGPTSWAWDFGDGNTSTQQNPSHTYNGRGFFIVGLIATNSDGSSDKFEISIGVTNLDYPPLSLSIFNLIDSYIPEGLLTTGEKSNLIRKWQLYLQPLVDPEVLEINMFDEFYYPALVNELIAELVALDLIIQAVNTLLIESATESSSSGEGTPSNGAVKSVKTGPAEATFESAAEAHAEASATINNLSKPGGAIDMLKAQICMLADRLQIYLPVCKTINRTVIPSVFKPEKPGTEVIITR